MMKLTTLIDLDTGKCIHKKDIEFTFILGQTQTVLADLSGYRSTVNVSFRPNPV